MSNQFAARAIIIGRHLPWTSTTRNVRPIVQSLQPWSKPLHICYFRQSQGDTAASVAEPSRPIGDLWIVASTHLAVVAAG